MPYISVILESGLKFWLAISEVFWQEHFIGDAVYFIFHRIIKHLMSLAVFMQYPHCSCLSKLEVKNLTTFRSQATNHTWVKWARQIVPTKEHKPCLKGAFTVTKKQQPVLAKWECGPRVCQKINFSRQVRYFQFFYRFLGIECKTIII